MLEGEHIESAGEVVLSGRIEYVAGDGELAADACWNVAPLIDHHIFTEKRSDGRTASKPSGMWWHRPGGILDQESQKALDVAVFYGSGVALGQGTCPTITEDAELKLLADTGYSLGDFRSRPLQGTVDRCN